MLKRLEKADVAAVLEYLGDDAVSVGIKANLSVYGTDYSFAEFWAQYDADNAVCAVLSKLSGACTLTFSGNADREELSALLDFISCSTVFLDKAKADELKTEYTATGDILCFVGKKIENVPSLDSFTDMKKAFAIIGENEGKSITKLDYLEWLSDFTFKSNRGAASLRAINSDSGPKAFAMTSAQTENAAIISGVFTKKEYRRKGLGETVLRVLTHSLTAESKKVYIMTAEKEMTAYYEKRGFEVVGSWCEIKAT